MGPETYLEFLEDLRGSWGWAVALPWSKHSDSGGPRDALFSCCFISEFFFFFCWEKYLKKNIFHFIFKLYNIVLVLPNIEMNPPQVYMSSPS